MIGRESRLEDGPTETDLGVEEEAEEEEKEKDEEEEEVIVDGGDNDELAEVEMTEGVDASVNFTEEELTDNFVSGLGMMPATIFLEQKRRNASKRYRSTNPERSKRPRWVIKPAGSYS